jgi:hypothetical protein
MVTNLLPSSEKASTVFGDPRSLTIPDPPLQANKGEPAAPRRVLSDNSCGAVQVAHGRADRSNPNEICQNVHHSRRDYRVSKIFKSRASPIRRNPYTPALIPVRATTSKSVGYSVLQDRIPQLQGGKRQMTLNQMPWRHSRALIKKGRTSSRNSVANCWS